MLIASFAMLNSHIAHVPQGTDMTPLCPSTELAEGQSRGFQIGELRLLVIRKGAQVHAFENRCPHRGVPLEWQPDQFLDTSGSLIQCATHGALFLIDSGECVAGPCSGQTLRALPTHEADGFIWLQDNETDGD